ncbi:Protein of unknown function [Pyronema omphalodes CBS 100304]|uniref:Uncharacterized protein n=1 Tax=Pyronema omphalodes (strain CBS 100304) TaxID=1076935 RepID=U4L7T9_PYROM|nr:Protein of unknown function [Pyronema omphalodes CBS 100304]
MPLEYLDGCLAGPEYLYTESKIGEVANVSYCDTNDTERWPRRWWIRFEMKNMEWHHRVERREKRCVAKANL